MDQKRILWIVAATGLFLIVVIGFATILSSPVLQNNPNLESLQGNGKTWIKGEIQGSSVTTPSQNNVALSTNTNENEASSNNEAKNQLAKDNNQTISVDTVTLIAGTTNVYTNSQDSAVSEAPKTSESPNQTTINLNVITADEQKPVNNQQTVTVAQPKETVKPATTQPSTAKTVTTNTADCEEDVKVTSTSKTTSKATTTSNKKPSSSNSVTKTQPVADQYWVQVASFTGKKNAEDARAALLEEKINSEIFTYKDSKGVVYYRLRVGPYTTKSEAEYWHSRIKLIEQFAGTSSYVVNSTGKAQN